MPALSIAPESTALAGAGAWMGQRQPDVQRPEAGLQAEPEQQQGQGQMIDRLRLPAGEVEGQRSAVAAQQQPGKQQHFAADRQLQIQPPGAPRPRSTVVHDQPVGSQAHGTEAEVEAQRIGGDDQQQVAGQCQLPEGPEAQPSRPMGQAAAGENRGAAPEHGGKAQPGASQRIVGAPAHAFPEPGSSSDGGDCSVASSAGRQLSQSQGRQRSRSRAATRRRAAERRAPAARARRSYGELARRSAGSSPVG